MNLKTPVFIQGAQTNSPSPPSYQANTRVCIEIPASGATPPEVLYVELLGRVVKQTPAGNRRQALR